MSDSATPWTEARQAPLSLGFCRHEYCSGFSFPPPGDPPNPGIKPVSPALAGRFFTAQPPAKPPRLFLIILFLNFWGVEVFCFFFFFFRSGSTMHTMWNLSSLTRLNLQPLQWEYGVLTPELPGKFFFFWLGGLWDLSPPK